MSEQLMTFLLCAWVAGIAFGPVTINFFVALFFGRRAAIASVVITYFAGLLALTILMLGFSTPDGLPAIPVAEWLPTVWSLVSVWAEMFLRFWYTHIPYLLVGAAGAWGGLALRRRKLRSSERAPPA